MDLAAGSRRWLMFCLVYRFSYCRLKLIRAIELPNVQVCDITKADTILVVGKQTALLLFAYSVDLNRGFDLNKATVNESIISIGNWSLFKSSIQIKPISLSIRIL